MIEAILFDLDDTLLGNNIDEFIPAYFSLLSQHAQPYMEPNKFLQELMICTQAMAAGGHPNMTNRDVFWDHFEKRNQMDSQELEAFFDQFYRGAFEELEAVCQQRPASAELVQTCLDDGLKVVVATNPMFPKTAIDARLKWAGVPVTEYGYDLVTTYENMHSTKPFPAYYTEILSVIDCAPEHAVMIGDNWHHDIVPSAGLGLSTFWITGGDSPPDETLVTGHGTLDDLLALISDGWLQTISRN